MTEATPFYPLAERLVNHLPGGKCNHRRRYAAREPPVAGMIHASRIKDLIFELYRHRVTEERMRIEIGYKFIGGFLLVVTSVVLMELLVPHFVVVEELRQLVTITSAIVIGLMLGVAFAKAFTVNIQRVREGAERLSRGDLSTRIALRRPLFTDETVDLAAALNTVTLGLSALVTQIRNASESVAVSAHQLSFTSLEMKTSCRQGAETVEKIAFGVDLQKDMVEKATQLIREVAHLAELVAASAQKMALSADKTAAAAEDGSKTSTQTTEMLLKILRETEILAQQLLAHRTHLQKIDNFAEVLIDIAEQTPLLYPHAPEERAAASGAPQDHHLRRLAGVAHQTATEIARLIETIGDENQAILSSMTETMARITAGRSALDRTRDAFAEITTHAATTRERAISIAELSQRQSDGVLNIVAAVDEISRATTENAFATREAAEATNHQTTTMSEMAHAANYLNSLAADLTLAVQRFQLEAAPPAVTGAE